MQNAAGPTGIIEGMDIDGDAWSLSQGVFQLSGNATHSILRIHRRSQNVVADSDQLTWRHSQNMIQDLLKRTAQPPQLFSLRILPHQSWPKLMFGEP